MTKPKIKENMKNQQIYFSNNSIYTRCFAHKCRHNLPMNTY